MHIVCEANNCAFILQMQTDDASFRHAVTILRVLDRVLPRLSRCVGTWTCDGRGFILLDRFAALLRDLQGTLDAAERERMFDAIARTIHRLHSIRIAHMNLTADTIVFEPLEKPRRQGTWRNEALQANITDPWLIDFSRAKSFRESRGRDASGVTWEEAKGYDLLSLRRLREAAHALHGGGLAGSIL